MAFTADYFLNGLKSRNEEVRLEYAIDLQRHVNTEVQEISSEKSMNFMKDLIKRIAKMISSSDINDMKGGLLGVVSLIDVFEMKEAELSRFSAALRDSICAHDIGILEITAYVIGRIVSRVANHRTEHVSFQFNRCLEWLTDSQNNSEFRRRAAVLVLTQIAYRQPTVFYQSIQIFFNGIFNVVFDYRQGNRECAVETIGAAFEMLVRRELKDRNYDSPYYMICYNKVMEVLEHYEKKDINYTAKDDYLHGALLLLNQILKVCNVDSENTEEFSMLKSEISEKNKSLSSKQFEVSSKLLVNSSKVCRANRGLAITDNSTIECAKMEYPKSDKDIMASRICIEIIRSNYRKIMRHVMHHLHSKSNMVQTALMKLLPRLAAFEVSVFTKTYMKDAFKFLFNCIKKDRDRPMAFDSIAVLCHVIRANVKEHLPEIIQLIKQYLPVMAKRRNTAIEPSIFHCITVLSRMSGFIKSVYTEILPQLFTVGLSEPLIETLYHLSQTVGEFTLCIHQGILELVRKVLLPKAMTDHVSSMEINGVATTTLALRMLASFEFMKENSVKSFELPVPFNELCHEISSEKYLLHESSEVRTNAVLAIVSLMKPMIPPTYITPKGAVMHPILSVTLAGFVQQVLKLAVTDLDPNVRLQVVRSLDTHFNYYLTLSENMNYLVMALQDEEIEVREAAMQCFARLGCENPALVVPVLRKILLQLTNELKFSGIGRNKLHAVSLIGHLARNSRYFMQHHVVPTIKTLIHKLNSEEQTSTVSVGIMKTIGELANIGGEKIVPDLDEILPTVINMMENVTCFAKRQAALITLGKIIQSTGYVVTPYHKYPTLKETLLSFISNEESQKFRTEVMRVLGLLGLHDPYKQQIQSIPSPALIKRHKAHMIKATADPTVKKEPERTASELVVLYGSASDEFYTVVAVKSLMQVLSDPNLLHHHLAAVEAVSQMFNTMSVKCIPYLKEIIPTYLIAMEISENKDKRFFVQQLSGIVISVKQHVRTYTSSIITAIEGLWEAEGALQVCLITLVKEIASALSSDFKLHLPQIIPHVLQILEYDSSEERTVTLQLLDALRVFGISLDEYISTILPSMLHLLKCDTSTVEVRNAVLNTLKCFCNCIDLQDMMSHIYHRVIHVIEYHPENHPAAMDALCAAARQFRTHFLTVIPGIRKVLTKQRIVNTEYDSVVAQIKEGGDEVAYLWSGIEATNVDTVRTATMTDAIAPKNQHINAAKLQQIFWKVQRQVSKEDWVNWLNDLTRGLIGQSPSIALRSCTLLSNSYCAMAKNLFCAAFLSIWCNLDEIQQDDFVKCLEIALKTPDCPPEVIHSLLNLAEFMEHTEIGALPMTDGCSLLGQTAWNCRAYAKALHYKEQEGFNNLTHSIVGDLINIYSKLGQPEAADGVLNCHKKALENSGQSTKYHSVDVEWYERLHKWEEAKQIYQSNLRIPYDSAYETAAQRNRNMKDSGEKTLTPSERATQNKLGYLRSLEALGEWDEMYRYSEVEWNQNSAEERRQMARLFASSAWGLHKWDKMDEYTCSIPRNQYDGMLYRAVIAIHHGHYSQARTCIGEAREILDPELTALASESHTRAYPALVNCQLLSELEEAIMYKNNPDRASVIRKAWWNRLQDIDKNLEDWQRIIQVRSLVVSCEEEMHTLLKFANLCRKNGRQNLAQRTLVRLLGCDPEKMETLVLPTAAPYVSMAYLKHMWKEGSKTEQALDGLLNYVRRIQHIPRSLNEVQRKDFKHLLSKCFLRLGRWHRDVHGLDERSIPTIVEYLKGCTLQDGNWYKAWHAWSMINFDVVNFYKGRIHAIRESGKKQTSQPSTPLHDGGAGGDEGDDNDADNPQQDSDPEMKEQKNAISNEMTHLIKFAAVAVQGFFRSIALCQSNSLQDCLRVLTLWFDYGYFSKVNEKLVEGIKSIQIEHWLQVIPQLIARIASPRPAVAALLHELLTNIGKEHPQALIYSLAVASKAEKPQQNPANEILSKMCEHSAELVQQTVMVSEELIRVAILWHEMWHEGLEEASRLYFAERDINGMLAALEPLHARLDKGPITLKEKSFNQAYGRDLKEANSWCKKYTKTNDMKELNQAWDLYYQVFRRISKQLPQLTTLELDYVSPKLMESRDLDLAVPGTYEPGRPIICIQSVNQTLQVITSKQRPRKLCIRGSDGKDYSFLLKGHEDLRQDERVMQLFGLVNTLLSSDPNSNRKNLSIQKLSVVPLSMNSGLIGWVPNCDTFHALIREYREKKKILLNIEHRIMLKMAPDYDHLPLLRKVEVFEHAIKNTAGDDLSKLLWLKSPTSEVWFDRRTNFTRSLAVMSMVGYVLGLGDRHPSNLMLDRISGKVLHIDFGDCFEVAMAREKFPEKIPFRLTRMLVNAMEVTGIEGNYKHVCHTTMSVLRHNRESIMAVLEAFVYDPLLNWRLVENDLEVASTHSQFMATGNEMVSTFGRVLGTEGGHAVTTEVLNKKALTIVKRVRAKLTGCDFGNETVDIQQQVAKLIELACSYENLCQCYIGWCSFW